MKNKIDLNNYKEINLEQLQEIYYQRFPKVHDFLVKHNIKYFAIGGTLLGAVRHKGFIPWDDDMDIGMLREDYEKFKKVCLELNNDVFEVESFFTTKYVNHSLIRILFKDTYSNSNFYLPCFSKHIAIDIFPYDSVPNSLKDIKKIEKYSNHTKRKIYLKSKNLFKNKIKKVIACFYQFVSSKKYSKIARNIDLKASFVTAKNPTSLKITNMMGAYSYERESIERRFVDSIILLPFGPIMINCPSMYKEFLSSVYGNNYMTPAEIRFDPKTFKAYILK